ncbi:MAG: hypothetical protein M3Y52_05745, partial [Actinomycetota bacterium]|nr:hypothetical protein [Actinomycetota bacterium]
AKHLACTAATAAGRVAGRDVVTVALGGRVLEESRLLRERVRASLAERAPAAVVREAEGDPLAGALGLGTGAYPDRYGALIHHWHATDHSERTDTR